MSVIQSSLLLRGLRLWVKIRRTLPPKLMAPTACMIASRIIASSCHWFRWIGQTGIHILHFLHYINFDVPGLGATWKNEPTKGKTLSGFKSCRIWQGIPTVQEFVIPSTFVVKSLNNLLSKWVEIYYVYSQIAGKTHKASHGLLWQWSLLTNSTWDPKDEPSEPWPSRHFPEESRTCGKSVVAPRKNARNIYKKNVKALSSGAFEWRHLWKQLQIRII